MSTAALPIPHPASPELVSVEHVHDLITDKMELLRDLKSARVRGDNAIRQLQRVLVKGPDRPIGMANYEGQLAVLMSSGRIRVLRTVEVAGEDVAGFSQEWAELPPLPETAAAILASVMEPAYLGMAVVP